MLSQQSQFIQPQTYNHSDYIHFSPYIAFNIPSIDQSYTHQLYRKNSIGLDGVKKVSDALGNCPNITQLTLGLDILLNYVSDEFELEIPQILFIIPPLFQDIVLGGNYFTYYNPIIYYSRFEVKYDLYFTKTRICYQQGSAVILTTECNQNIQPNQPLYYYNKYIMMCQNSGIVLPNCRNLSIIDFTCIQCIDSQMILLKTVLVLMVIIMINLLKLAKVTLICLLNVKCSAVCKTCSFDKNNCLECKGQNQIPPLQCSQKCSNSFLDNQFNCLTCSQGRINPPLCQCNPILNQSSIFDSILSPCIPKSCCPYKCLACDINNQCIQCRGDDMILPLIVCALKINTIIL
ncbi:hypothetical protein ABPG72_008500 [Tetrahymena utriculariae]